jgi:hypothetical protein
LGVNTRLPAPELRLGALCCKRFKCFGRFSHTAKVTTGTKRRTSC